MDTCSKKTQRKMQGNMSSKVTQGNMSGNDKSNVRKKSAADGLGRDRELDDEGRYDT